MGTAKNRIVAIYTRVSTGEQAASGLGLQDQLTRARAYASALGLGECVEVFTDAGQSAKNLDRPELARLMGLVKRRKVSAIVVLKLDRLTRNVVDLLDLVKLTGKHGTALHSVSERLDTQSASGRMMITMLGAVAEWERDTISERTRAAIKVKRAQGIAHGYAPLGARKVGGKLKTVRAEVEALDLIRSRRAEGASFRTIARELSEAGFKTKRGGEWRPGTVHRIVTRIERDGFAAGVEVAS